MLGTNNELKSVAILGDASSGKSSIIRNIMGMDFKKNLDMTIGANYSINLLEIDNNMTLKLRICDVAGQSSFSKIRQNFIRNSDAALIVFDLTNTKSFESVAIWIKDFLTANQFNTDLPILLVGNKADLYIERRVKLNDIQQMVENIKFQAINPNIIGYVETSAKTGKGIQESFYQLGLEINGS